MKSFYWVSLLFLVLLLGACGGAYTAATSSVGPIDTPTPGSQPTTTHSIAASGKFQEFALPRDNSGLMRPASTTRGASGSGRWRAITWPSSTLVREPSGR
jgi:hypothetical protein